MFGLRERVDFKDVAVEVYDIMKKNSLDVKAALALYYSSVKECSEESDVDEG